MSSDSTSGGHSSQSTAKDVTKKRKPNGKGKSKVDNDYIQTTSKRRVAFSKRKAGLMKKASELASMTGAQVLLVVVSESKSVYAFSTPDLSSLIEGDLAQRTLKSCLNLEEAESPNVLTAGSSPS